MSVDSINQPYYNRKQRREMKREGKLVRYNPIDKVQFVCEHSEEEWCSECIWLGRQMAREIVLPKDHPDKGKINF